MSQFCSLVIPASPGRNQRLELPVLPSPQLRVYHSHISRGSGWSLWFDEFHVNTSCRILGAASTREEFPDNPWGSSRGRAVISPGFDAQSTRLNLLNKSPVMPPRAASLNFLPSALFGGSNSGWIFLFGMCKNAPESPLNWSIQPLLVPRCKNAKFAICWWGNVILFGFFWCFFGFGVGFLGVGFFGGCFLVGFFLVDTKKK